MELLFIEKIRGLQRFMLVVQQIETPELVQIQGPTETVIAQATCEIMNFANVFCAISTLV